MGIEYGLVTLLKAVNGQLDIVVCACLVLQITARFELAIDNSLQTGGLTQGCDGWRQFGDH